MSAHLHMEDTLHKKKRNRVIGTVTSSVLLLHMGVSVTYKGTKEIKYAARCMCSNSEIDFSNSKLTFLAIFLKQNSGGEEPRKEQKKSSK